MSEDSNKERKMLEFTLAPNRGEMLDSLCKLLSIESVKSTPDTMMPYGKGVFNALMNMLELADHLDFDSVNLYSHIGYVDYGEGDETLAVLTHLDVVPAGDGWTYPPFEGTVVDGRVYGRGAIDNKGPAIAAMYALHALKENSVELNKRVRLLFGCDEESGWNDIDFYKKTVGEIPDMAICPDADFPIINSEKGMVQFSFSAERPANPDRDTSRLLRLLSLEGGDRVNVVPGRAECMLACPVDPVIKLVELFSHDSAAKFKWDAVADDRLKIMVRGRSAHASTPQEGVNAVAWLISFLNTLPLADDAMSRAVHAIAKKIGTATDGSTMDINRRDASGPLTLNLGYFHTTDSEIRFGLDIRYPVSETPSFIDSHVKQAFPRFECEKVNSLPSHFVDPESELVTGLKTAYEEVTHKKAYCLSIGGATYARAFPNSVAFGPLFPGQDSTAHQPNEYIEINSFVQLADLLAAAIAQLCGRD